MPKKSKNKFKSLRNSMNCEGGQIFRNPTAAVDGTDPKMSLQYIQEIFFGKVDPDVIAMVFSECSYDVEQTVETLMKITAEDKEDFIPDSSDVIQESIVNTNVEYQEASAPLSDQPEPIKNSDDSFKKYIGNYHDIGSFTTSEFSDHQNGMSLCHSQHPLSDLHYENVSPPHSDKFTQQYNVDPSMCYFMPNTGETFPMTAYPWQLHSGKHKNSVPDFITSFHNSIVNDPSAVKSTEKGNNSLEDSKKSHLLFSPHGKTVDNGKKPRSAIQLAMEKIKSGLQVLIILRGLPGSGKSTLAQKLRFNGVVLSTDDYFIHNGVYYFDWTKLDEAHIWNKMRAEEALSKGVSPVIIDNTNIEIWEMVPYIKLGRRYSYEILILEPNTFWKFKPKELSLKNKHGVPKEKIIKMLNRYQHNVTVESICKNFCIQNSPIKLTTDESVKNSEQISQKNPTRVSLEAVIHQEEHSCAEISNGNLKSDASELPVEEFSLPLKSKIEDVSEKGTDDSKNVAIKSLEELKSLVNVDSEESQSQSSEDISSKSGDLSHWVDITEPDNDFMWKKVSQREMSPPISLNSVEQKSISKENCNVSGKFYDEKCLKNGSVEENKVSVSMDGGISLENVNELNSSFENLSLPSNKISENMDLTKVCEKEVDTVDNVLNYSKSSSMNNLNLKTSHFPSYLDKSSDNKVENIVIKDDSKLGSSLPKSFSFPNKSDYKYRDLLELCKKETKTENKLTFNDPILNIKEEIPPDWGTLNSNCDVNDNDSWIFCKSPKKFSLPEIEQPGLEWTADESNNIIPTSVQSSQSTEAFEPKPQRTNIARNVRSKSLDIQENISEDKLIKLDNFIEWESENYEEIQSSLPEDLSNCLGLKNYAPKPQRKLHENRKKECDDKNFISLPPQNSLIEADNLDEQKTKNENNATVSEKYKHKRFSLFKDALPLDKNWVFPVFISDEINCNENPINKIVSVSTASSQTEPEDFVALYKTESGKKCPEKYFILIPSQSSSIVESKTQTSSEKEESNVVQIAKFDKSTSTDDLIPDTDDVEKMCAVKECFPDICDEDILHFLELCNGNVTWLINLLIDSGYEYNCPLYQTNTETGNENLDCSSLHLNFFPLEKTSNEINSSQNLINPITNPDSNSQNLHPEIPLSSKNCFSKYDCDPSSSKLELDPALILSRSIDHETSSIESSHSEKKNGYNNFKTLPLILDTAFVNQLEKFFGRVIPEQSNGSLSPSQRTIQIDFELAELLHDKLKENVKMKSLLTNVDDNKEKRKRKKKLNRPRSRDVTPPTPEQTANKTMTLSEIMDMELAVQIYKKETLKKDPDFATKAKRQELYNLYPGADTVALDEIFESNNYSLQNCIKILGEEFGEQITVPRKSATEKIEQHVSEENNLDILKDFENSDWSGWVYKSNSDTTQETVIPSPCSTISAEAAELREKATHHFNQRQEFIGKAKNSFYRGMKDAASFYSREASDHYQKFRQCNKMASEIISQQRNEMGSASTLDLHGLYVQEAIPCVERFLRGWRLELRNSHSAQFQTVSIITGQGHHSIRGPKLRPSVIEYLRKSGYRFTEINSGVIEIMLEA